MVDVKEAVKIALENAQSLLGPERTSQIELEEVDQDGEGKNWLITVSVLRYSSPTMTRLTGGPKDYKVFTIDRISGDVKSMKIRELSFSE